MIRKFRFAAGCIVSSTGAALILANLAGAISL